MKDMLVSLIHLPDISKLEEEFRLQEILFRQPIAPEQSLVIKWVEAHFSRGWADEMAASFNHQPVSCYLAQKNNQILGFACYEATCRNFFGPTGVIETERQKGLGKVLLIKSLEALRSLGYAYAIIGGVGPIDFYEKAVGATVIDQSDKGIYRNMLKVVTNQSQDPRLQ